MKNINKRCQWSNNALELAMEAIHKGYSYSQASAKYDIPKSSLRDHVIRKTRSKTVELKGVLNADEEFALCDYVQEMAEIGHLHKLK